MKTIILFLLVIFIQTTGYCQSVIDIQYTRYDLRLNEKNQEPSPSAYMPRMVFNDSFALVYFFSSYDNKAIRGKKIGHKLMHHGTFHNLITRETFWEIKWSDKNKYLVKDTTAETWQFFDESRTILNKTCHGALSVNKNNDSIIVWYTTDLLFKNGPLFYKNIPGVVLESYDQRKNQHYLATKIKEHAILLVQPEEGKFVSPAEWEQIRSNYSNK